MRTDAGQLENALLNIAINVRDAMPAGGNLSFTCSNTQIDSEKAGADIRGHFVNAPGDSILTGDYAVISLSDTGTGMLDEVIAQAFEPFFTTKDIGKGSGLGLSMVYGFALQSCGEATIESEPGHGSTIRIYLPRSMPAGEHGVALKTDAAAEKTGSSRDETILLIEDTPDVLNLVRRMLETLGYRVETAISAVAARTILERDTPIDLVLSDVMLAGGESGVDFAMEMRRARPDLRVVLMSGYPEEIGRNDRLAELGTFLLIKPFRRAALARALRAALD